jgi:hypothetical protein
MTATMLQDLAALLVVLAALAYLVWKFGWARRTPRVRRGPDVPLSRLKRRH